MTSTARQLLLGVAVLSLAANASAKGFGLSALHANSVDKSTPMTLTDEDLVVADFEGGQGDWMLETAGGSPGWEFGDAAAATSEYMPYPDHTNFAYANSDLAGEGVTMDDYLVSPFFSLTEASFAFVELAYLHIQSEGAYEGWCDVLVRQGGGAWDTVMPLADTGGAWTDLNFDLNAYVGLDFLELAFHFYDNGNWAYGSGIDDVRIFSAEGDEFGPELTVVPVYNALNANAPLSISAEIVDPSTVMGAVINYQINAGDMLSADMTNTAGDTWTGDMTGFSSGDFVFWSITATDFSDNQNVTESATFETEVGSPAWLRKDDGTLENAVGIGEGEWAAAVRYDPGVYPVTLYSLEINANYAEEGVEFHIWADDGGAPGADLVTPWVGALVENDFVEVLLDEWVDVNEPFFAGFVSQGNYLSLDTDGYFFENTTMVAVEGEWMNLSDAGFAGNYYIRVNAEYISNDPAEVTFAVDMNIQEELGNFDPAADAVLVRGSFNGWGGSDPTLTDGDGDGVYTGSYIMGDELIGTDIEYKFVNASATQGELWENVDNRIATVEGGTQTLETVFFNNVDYVPELLDVEVMFRVNMEIMTANGTFDPATDWIVMRGGHANLGNWGGAVVMTEEGGNPGHFFLNIEFDGLEADTNLEYKFVILEDQDETLAIWEGVANRVITPSATWPDNDEDGYGELVLDEEYFDNVGWDDIIAQEVTVHFAVDLWRVAQWFVEHEGEENHGLTSYEEIDYVGVCGPWNSWPWDLVPAEYQLTNTTGTWFEGDIVFPQHHSANIVYKYGANGSDNESGFQADWTAVIDDAEPTFLIENLFGDLGDFWNDIAVGDEVAQPKAFELGASYPNPFNPVTTIPYTLRNAGEVRLSIVNVLGQEVAVLANGLHQSGSHQASFNAANLSSGVYMAVLENGTSVETAKLLLVK
jgi:hypothetical protein